MLTFSNHPPSNPKTTDQIRHDFLTNVQKTWLLKKPKSPDEQSSGCKIIEHFALFVAISRFTDRLIKALDTYKGDIGDGENDPNIMWSATHTHYRLLADETALAHAQLIEVRNIFGLDIDIDRMVKQIYFEVAARYQATFECDILATKVDIDPEKSAMWRTRMMQESRAGKGSFISSL